MKFWILLSVIIFELCPYGIWNTILYVICNTEIDLNFVPMGFETSLGHIFKSLFKSFELCPYGIWNDKYEAHKLADINVFELCPYGIWNTVNSASEWAWLYLNFVPMGFETTWR